MIYDYYCVDCGNKLKGAQIHFDLAELLGLRGTKGQMKSRMTQISSEELQKLASQSNTRLVHGKSCRIEITLLGLLRIMGENAGGEALKNTMETFTRSTLIDALSEVYSTTENQEVQGDLISSFRDALISRFEYFGGQESIPEEDRDDLEKVERELQLRDDLERYRACFWVKPEYFEDGASEQIYSVSYTNEEHSPNYKKIMSPTEIRGYCPICGQPVLAGTGKYEHMLVGLLGVQSAGKTSTIVAMLKQIETSYHGLGLKYPGGALCDSRYEHRLINTKLYENGWAVKKTDKDTNIATFNASLLLQTENMSKTKILTFIDIAGEQCYDTTTRTVNAEALEIYPLINSCDMYLLCSCIDQNGYGNADGIKSNIPIDAVVEIARGIYGNLRNPAKVPPLCIVLTKADLAPEDMQPSVDENPFATMKVDAEYLYRDQITVLHTTYEQYDQENIQEPLRWCVATYEDMKKRTYVSMLSTSALGREATTFTGNEKEIDSYTNDDQKLRPFVRQRLDVLWKWITQVAGLGPIGNSGYCFPYVPSYGESYADGGGDRADSATPRRVYTIAQSEQRINAVRNVFLNMSEQDNEILGIWEAVERRVPFRRGDDTEKKIRRIRQALGRD